MELTNRFTKKKATITYPDGSTDDVEYVNRFLSSNGMVGVYENSPESWDLRRTHGEPYLDFLKLSQNETIYSVENFQKFDVDYTHDLVAVCEVDESKITETEQHGFLGRKERQVYTIPEDFEMPDVEIWEAIEWEAYQDDQ